MSHSDRINPGKTFRPNAKNNNYSDVTVIDADGRRIPWPEVSHFDDDAMRHLMRQIVDRLYTFEVRAQVPGFLERIDLWLQAASRWDPPKLDDSFFPNPNGDRNTP